MSSSEEDEEARRRVVQAGTRVSVYWPDDDEWYKGTVAEDTCNGNQRIPIKYDDGDRGWLNIHKDKFRSSQTADSRYILKDSTASAQKRAKVAKLKVGDRISVWWPREKEYYTGTLREIKQDNSTMHDLVDTEDEESVASEDDTNRKPHFIVYDDGDEEWTNLIYRKFKQIDPKAERLCIGSRVSVYHKEKDRSYPASVVKIKLHKARPHKVKYDKEKLGTEWINLNVLPFIDIDDKRVKTPAAAINANNLRKRKQDFMKDPDKDAANKKSTRDFQLGEEERNVKQPLDHSPCQETCAMCRSCAEEPRAASCCHIFCKECIESEINQRNTDLTCPVCNVAITADLVEFDPEHVSFKPVESFKQSTAELRSTFSSASAASIRSNRRFKPFLIIGACQGKRRDDKDYGGYFWRFQGSGDRILRLGEGVKDGVPIEQVDLKTGEVIEVFSSGRKAQEKTKVSRCVIKRVLERRGKADGGGFFWRFQGENHGPWPDPEPSCPTSVERLDYKTGDLLEVYNSLADAKRAMGMKQNTSCIRDVCNGNGRGTAKGYFWRWYGSTAVPNHLLGVQKTIQIRKKRGGKVLKEFRTSRDAQAYFGHQCCWSTVCHYCQEEGFYMGYFWKYRMLRKPKSPEEEMINKRLNLLCSDGEWCEGKVMAFNSDTKKHEILLDSGSLEHHNLNYATFEWKNDQGQRPVEQLDMKTGVVLATFCSVSDAARAVDTAMTRISAVCSGRYKSTAGFFWRYKGSNNKPRKQIGKRKVEQLCLETGQVIATFESIQDAGKAVGITTPGISYCCNGRNNSKSAGGFGWRFAKEED